MIHMFAVPIWSSPAFNPNPDILSLLNGAIIGGVGVLPSTSRITYCQKNSSAIYDQAFVIYDNVMVFKWGDAAQAIRTFLRMVYSITFNCYYTVTNPVQAA